MDKYNLQRFVEAQETETYFESYDCAIEEVRNGLRCNRWVWYVFPRLRGLGQSIMSQTYSICDVEEARAYLAHPVLGPRIVEISQAILVHRGESAKSILGSRDCEKLHASMTLFAHVHGSDHVFREVLDAFYDGKDDEKTAKILSA